MCFGATVLGVGGDGIGKVTVAGLLDLSKYGIHHRVLCFPRVLGRMPGPYRLLF